MTLSTLSESLTLFFRLRGYLADSATSDQAALKSVPLRASTTRAALRLDESCQA
jgi:hypothetical protein